jgi:dTDP-4-amino-4,6-dideoxygalactose transaminase
VGHRERFLLFSPPSITDDEIDEVVDTLRSGWLTTGPKTEQFEKEIAGSVGAPAAHAVSSGTAAMHCALAALGIGAGDAVVTSAITFASTVHVIEHMGSRPVLVDVDPETLNIDPERAAAAVHADPSVKALLPVHLYGHPADMDALLELAESRELSIVEDAAHAFPSSWGRRPIGGWGTTHPRVVTAFSFYATKNITTGEGGMLTGATEVVEEARRWSLHGIDRDAWHRYAEKGSWYYEVVRPGFKYNMSDVQAALGLAQLRRLPDMQRRREQIWSRYTEGLSALEEIELPTIRPQAGHSRHLFVIRLDLDRLAISRDRFIEELRGHNIGSSVHFIPIHRHPYYRDRYGLAPAAFPIAEREYQRIVSLPLHPGMSNEDADDVIDAIGDIVKEHRR